MTSHKKYNTPSSANWLASKFIDDGLLEEFFGDLEEIYEDRIEVKGKVYAKLMYWVDVFHLLIGFSSIRIFRTNPTIMYRHYLLAASRNLVRNKAYSAINILGLAVGMGVCLLIYQYIQFEMSYDKFHSDVDNKYRITLTTLRNGENINSEALTTHALGAAAKESIPEIKNLVRIRPMLSDEGIVVSNTLNHKSFLEYNIYYVDNSFLKMFNFSLKYGDQPSALSGLNNVVITEQIAQKNFGDIDPVGKILKLNGGSLSGNFTVSGVLNKLPENSHLQFDFLLPLEFMLSHYGLYVRNNGWQWYNMVTYLTLDKSSNLESLAAKFDQIIEANIGDKLTRSNSEIKTGFQPLTGIHLNPSIPDNFSNTFGDIHNLWFFGIVAIFILIIAWVNYINLSTAKAIQRAKEVGIRKTMGAIKKQLISQFLFESFLINCLATIIAISIAFLLLPFLGQIIGKELTLTVPQNPQFWIGLVLIVLLGSILSGLYPAFVLSSFSPISTLNRLKFRPDNNFSLRKSLIVFQFSTSLLLISATYLIYTQIAFMKSKDLGVDMEKIVVVHGPRIILEEKKEIQTLKYKAFKDITASHHSVASITSTSNIPGTGEVWYGGMRKLGDPIDSQKTGSAVLVGAEFTNTYDLEFLSGKEFRPEMEPYSHVIINEMALKVFSLGSPIDALDESIVMGQLDTLKIQGVIKNIHWSSLKYPHVPMIFGIHEFHAYFSIKINVSNIPETLGYIESTYHEAFPKDPFRYYFLEDAFNRQYQTDLQFGNLFTAFTIIAIFVACIGLYALLAFSATQRIKEIGIRKVLGASMGNLMLLLSKEYFSLLLVASVLSIPLIFYFGNSWLENYAFRIEMGMEFFLVPAFILVVIALLTVSYRTYKTAKANPVESLKTE